MRGRKANVLATTTRLYQSTFYTLYMSIEKRMETIETAVKEIKENHLSHLQQDLTIVKVNQKWIMKFFWVVATASIAGLATGIANLLTE